jgi:hypothetical protein
MAATVTELACAQCGRAAPGEPDELETWAYGPIAVRGEFPEVIDVLLLCPECVDEDHDHDFDEGTGD